MTSTSEHQENIEKAEQMVEGNDDTYAIMHASAPGGEVHGYVTDGEEPVACVDILKTRLDDVLDENGVVGGQVAVSDASGDGPVHEYTEREPGDDGYIELLNDVLSWYVIVYADDDENGVSESKPFTAF